MSTAVISTLIPGIGPITAIGMVSLGLAGLLGGAAISFFFINTAYWAAALTTDQGGVAAVALGLAAPAHAQATFSNAVILGTVHITGLDETSGLAASRQNDAVLWTHNDSGDMARVFALDTQGRLLGTYKAYNWKPPAGYRFTFRGLFEIKWY